MTALPNVKPRDIGEDSNPNNCQFRESPLQQGVSGWISEGACLTQALDQLQAAPSALADTPEVTFCFALHTTASPEELLQWLQVNLTWRALALRWWQCHHLLNSAPENDTDQPLPSDSVVLVCGSVCTDPASATPAEQAIAKALQAELQSPVECYLSCPGQVPLFSGCLSDVTAQTPAAAAALLKSHGVAVLKGCMSTAAVELWRQLVQKQVAALEALLEERGVAVQENSIFTFREIAARGKHRFDARLDMGPAWAEATAAREFLASAPWLATVHELLGDDVATITSVVYSRPGADAQEWHSDGPPAAAAAGPAYAICAFVPLLDLTPATGCTQFWPGSHHHPQLLGFGPAAAVLEATVDGLVAAGDAVLYDYRTMHRGLPNSSGAGQRDVLQVVYHRKDYKEMRNYSCTQSLRLCS